MSDAAIDVAAFLQSDGVGTQGTDLFVNFMPDSPDECVGVYTLPGESESGDFFGNNTLPTFEELELQIIIRAGARDYPTASAKVQAIRASLNKIANETVNGTYYLRVKESQTASFDGADVQDRVHMTASYTVTKYL